MWSHNAGPNSYDRSSFSRGLLLVDHDVGTEMAMALLSRGRIIPYYCDMGVCFLVNPVEIYTE